MATYSLVHALAQTIAHSCDDGGANMYILSSSDDKVYKYQIASDTLTDISGGTFTGMDTNGVIAYFKGVPYVVVHNTGASKVQVYRYDGSGANWTLVHNVINTGGATFSPYMDADDARIIYSAFDGVATRYYYTSTNGTIWAQPLVLSQTPGNICYNDQTQRGGVLFACGAAGAIDVDECCWNALNGATFANRSLKGTGDTYSFFANSTAFYYSGDWGQNTNAIAGTWYYPTQPNIWKLGGVTWAVGLATGVNRDQVRSWNSGTLTFDLDGTPSATHAVMPRPTLSGGYLYVVVSGVGIYVRDAPLIVLTFDVSPKYEAKGMDASADDTYLYVACLEGGNPVLLRLLADLSADPIRAYNPGAGDAIAVIAGRQHDDWVWISGRFAGANKVALSDDDGGTWTVEDPGTWAGRAYPPLIGPDDDERMLIASDQDDDLHETLDAGDVWNRLNDALDFDIGDMDHLDISPDEVVMGRNTGGAARVEYSPNRGRAWNDVTAGTPNFETTTIIVG